MAPPDDQRILNDYFSLNQASKGKSIAWLYGMIATYGVQPNKLKDFTWGAEHTLVLKGKKTPVKPMHPHWAVIFNLKKQPRKIKERLTNVSKSLEKAQATGKIDFNIADLLLAHTARKDFYN